MTEKEEELLHIRNSIKVFNNVLNILSELQKDNEISPILFSASFQYALVEYAKPFKISEGLIKTRHRLNVEEYVNKASSELHQSILDARDQFHAHSDLTILDAKAHVDDHYVLYVQNRVHGLELLSRINDIISLVEKVLDKLLLKEQQLEKELTAQ